MILHPGYLEQTKSNYYFNVRLKKCKPRSIFNNSFKPRTRLKTCILLKSKKDSTLAIKVVVVDTLDSVSSDFYK